MECYLEVSIAALIQLPNIGYSNFFIVMSSFFGLVSFLVLITTPIIIFVLIVRRGLDADNY